MSPCVYQALYEATMRAVARNRECIRKAKEIGAPYPSLRASRITYEPSPLVDEPRSIHEIMPAEAADVDEIAAIRVAELLEQGRAADIVIGEVWKASAQSTHLTVWVWSDEHGLEQPERIVDRRPIPDHFSARCERDATRNVLIVECDHVRLECPLTNLDELRWHPHCDVNHVAAGLLTWLERALDTRELMQSERKTAVATKHIYYLDGHEDWFVARTESEAWDLIRRHYGYGNTSEEQLDGGISLCQWADDANLTVICNAEGHPDESGERITRTCREWAEREPVGLLASRNF